MKITIPELHPQLIRSLRGHPNHRKCSRDKKRALEVHSLSRRPPEEREARARLRAESRKLCESFHRIDAAKPTRSNHNELSDQTPLKCYSHESAEVAQ